MFRDTPPFQRLRSVGLFLKNWIVLIHKDALNWLKVTLKTFMKRQKIHIKMLSIYKKNALWFSQKYEAQLFQ